MSECKCTECCGKCQRNEREMYEIKNINWIKIKKELESNNPYDGLIRESRR